MVDGLTMKRAKPSNEITGISPQVDDTTRLKRRRLDSSLCDYRGYSFQKNEPIVQNVDRGISAEDFHQQFISQRRPCILKGPGSGLDKHFSINAQDLIDVAGNQVVQVEKRFGIDESFGQNRTQSKQLQMPVQEFVEKLATEEGELHYLSSQEPKEDQSDDRKVAAAFLVPCAQLLAAKKLTQTLPWAENLRLESCNMWMGSSRKGSSSGLHHDYHDNFYLLVRGTKQFRLFSPDTAVAMGTFGVIEKVHFNGVISYVGNETTADGASLRMLIHDDDERGERKDEEGSNDDDDSGAVLGKGFDYQSSEEDESFDEDGHDDFDELVGSDTDCDAGPETKEEETDRPNSFSKISLPQDGSKSNTLLPECKDCVIELKAGEILYLPAGWFHCVTSFSSESRSDDEQFHLAFNYWYHPPDRLDSFESPYKHDLSKSNSQ